MAFLSLWNLQVMGGVEGIMTQMPPACEGKFWRFNLNNLNSTVKNLKYYMLKKIDTKMQLPA
jgi:hypothetical protein